MKKATERLKVLIATTVLTFSCQTLANQANLNMRQLKCSSMFETLQIPSGAQLAKSLLTERMGSSYIFDREVEPALKYIYSHGLSAIESATKGAVWVIKYSSIAELNLLRTNQDFANGFAESLKSQPESENAWYFKTFEKGFKERPVTGEMFQRLGRLFFAYDYIRTLPVDANYYTTQQFTHLANLEGLQVQKHSHLFRIDSRDINELTQQKGFYPNPINKRGTISDHSSPRAGVMGAGFVSTTSEAGNRDNLSVWPIVAAAKVQSIESSVISELFPQVNQAETQNRKPSPYKWARENLQAPRLEILKTHEYEIVDALGAIPPKELSIESEKEIIIPFADINQIKRTREIYILAEVTRKNSGDLYEFDFVDVKTSEWKYTTK